jgi:hypothetical protein
VAVGTPVEFRRSNLIRLGSAPILGEAVQPISSADSCHQEKSDPLWQQHLTTITFIIRSWEWTEELFLTLRADIGHM